MYASSLNMAGFMSVLWLILGAVVILLIGVIAIAIISKVLTKSLAASKLDPTIQPFIVKAVKFVLWVFVIIMILQKLGMSTASLVAAIGAGGAAIALALQGSLSNVAGGILILVNKPFRVGDEIEVGGVKGVVDEIGLMATILHTWDNKIVTVPNGTVTSSVVLNYTESGLRRVEESFGVRAGSDIEAVKAAIKAACAKNAIFATQPEPIVGASGNGEGSIIFDCKVWCRTEDYYGAIYVLREAVAKEFAEAGIQGPSKGINVEMVNK